MESGKQLGSGPILYALYLMCCFHGNQGNRGHDLLREQREGNCLLDSSKQPGEEGGREGGKEGGREEGREEGRKEGREGGREGGGRMEGGREGRRDGEWEELNLPHLASSPEVSPLLAGPSLCVPHSQDVAHTRCKHPLTVGRHCH